VCVCVCVCKRETGGGAFVTLEVMSIFEGRWGGDEFTFPFKGPFSTDTPL
jgi:hypothetical protein